MPLQVSTTVDDGQDKDAVNVDPIDDSIPLHDELADIVSVASLGNAPTDSRVRFDPVRRGNELIDKQLSVVRYIASDLVVNVVEICRSNVRPLKSHSCGTSVCRTPSGQPPAVQIGNPADLAWRFFAEMRRFISS